MGCLIALRGCSVTPPKVLVVIMFVSGDQEPAVTEVRHFNLIYSQHGVTCTCSINANKINEQSLHLCACSVMLRVYSVCCQLSTSTLSTNSSSIVAIINHSHLWDCTIVHERAQECTNYCCMS